MCKHLAVFSVIVLGLFVSFAAWAERGFIPDNPGEQEYTYESSGNNGSSAPTRYFYQQLNIEVEVVEDTDGSQYAYTVNQYGSNPLDDGLYVISQDILKPYTPHKTKLRHGDYVMVILAGRIVNYYSADEVVY